MCFGSTCWAEPNSRRTGGLDNSDINVIGVHTKIDDRIDPLSISMEDKTRFYFDIATNTFDPFGNDVNNSIMTIVV
jgi:hypothetical protein